MDSASVEATPVEAKQEAADGVGPVTSQEISRHEQLNGMLANARNTKDMLEGFIAAINGSQISGHVIYRMAIGIQFLETLLKQSKGDIERLQEALKAKV